MTPLQQSIAHWKRIAGFTHIDEFKDSDRPTPNNCALCKKWAYLRGCEGCPVQTKTGMGYCLDTPYTTADNEFKAMSAGFDNNWPEASKAEVEFLESLESDNAPG